MKSLIIPTIFFLLLIQNSLAFLQIVEVMYNPEGSDNNQEYIEVLTDLNLTNFTIQDYNSEDQLELIKYFHSNYSLIVEEGFNHTGINATIYTTGATIGNNLNNDPGDIVIIKNQTSVLDTLHYYSSWGADNNGNSLCILNNQWLECLPTPGRNNTETTIEYNIKINEFLPDPQGNDSAHMPEGEWIELINYGKETDLLDFSLKDKFGHTITITDTNTYSTKIDKYLVVYTNGFHGFLNNEDSEKISLYSKEGYLLDEITYSSSKEGLSWSKSEEGWIETIPTPNKENEKNKANQDSKIEIEKIYLGNDNKAKFGDTIRVKISTYKGSTSKTSIKVWLERKGEKLSKTTSFNIEERYKETSITVPIQIYPNCKEKHPTGTYQIVAEGLDEKDEDTIIIEGITKNLCQETYCKKTSTIQGSCAESNINTQNFTQETLYESTNKKTEKSGIMFFCLALVFIIIQLNIEKWRK